MIVAVENGRLGNQLFQIGGLQTFFPHHTILLIGFESLSPFQWRSRVQIVRIPLTRIVWVKRSLSIILRFLEKTRVFGTVSEKQTPDSFTSMCKRGLFSNIYVASSVFFQHRQATGNSTASIELDKRILAQAADWLSMQSPPESDHDFVFVHVRRGDYLTWPTTENPAALPLWWYERAIAEARRLLANPFFIVVSDDRDYVLRHFGLRDGFAISEGPVVHDLALMSLCANGILSASSLSWWGARLNFDWELDQRVLIAPKYWFGFHEKKWSPPGVEENWLSYI